MLHLITLSDRTFSCRASHSDVCEIEAPPLIIALHGGTYSSTYFDVPGHSLLARAEALKIPIMAIDRPGYGDTTLDGVSETSHAGNAAVLTDALHDLWLQHGEGRAGIVLIGHSIGGAIALHIAAGALDWPLIGVAVSGVGLHNAPIQNGRSVMPDTPFIEMSAGAKDALMFGAVGTYVSNAPDASRVADAPVPRQELIDISSTWPREASHILGRIRVPVHYRQADHDNLWIVNADEIDAFASSCAAARYVDARIIANAGHCIDFHSAGPSFQLEQLAFALRCAVDYRIGAGQ